MTDQPTITSPAYTEADLYTEAARQHATLTGDPDFMGVGEVMQGTEPWESLGEDAYELAQNKVTDLINGAADVSDWAVRLGEAGLTPQPPMAWYGTGGYELAVQVATTPQLTDSAREELLREIRTAVDKTVKRVLHLKDADPKRAPMDPVHILGIDAAEDDGETHAGPGPMGELTAHRGPRDRCTYPDCHTH